MIRGALFLLALGTSALPAQAPRRQLSVTFDDLPSTSVIAHSEQARQMGTTLLLRTLTSRQIPAIGFVNEGKLGALDAPLSTRMQQLRDWLSAGMELGNHTRSHLGLHAVALSEYLRDIALGDSLTRHLMRPRRPRYFRHPFLHAGRNSLVRDSLAQFLAARGYTIAPVTIDNSDYIFAAAFDRRIAARDFAGADSIGRTYVRYMEQVVIYYEGQSQALFGREIPQILLVHANALNSRYFGAIADILAQRGYGFISLEEALRDPAYAHADTYYGSAGISWLHRWAITEGRKGNFFAGEPEVPAWIERASQP